MPGERNYSHRTLFDKLGVKAQHVCAIRNITDAAFIQSLDEALEKPASRSLRGEYDAIFLQIDRLRDVAEIARVAEHLRPAGALWIFHPKGKNAAVKDGEVRAADIAAGLVDNKISAYNDTHTATRYVIPVARRKKHSLSP